MGRVVRHPVRKAAGEIDARLTRLASLTSARRLAPYAVLAVIAAVPAFYLLGERGFWGDEIWTVWWSRLFGWLGTFTRFNAPPDLPLSFLITKLALLNGQSEFAARLPHALMGIGSVLLVFHIARRRLGRWTAFFAALLLAIAPLHVWYEQEARPYAGLEFLSLLSLAFFLRLLDRPNLVAIGAFAMANALNVYNHLFGVFPLVAELVVGFGLIAVRWAGRGDGRVEAPRRSAIARALAVGTLAFAVLIAPIVPGILRYGLEQRAAASTPISPSLEFFHDLLAGFGVGYGWPVIGLTALALLGVGAAIARREPLGVIAPAWILLPIGLLFLFAPAHHFINRYALFMVPIYLLMLAHGAYVAGSAAVAVVQRFTARRIAQPGLAAAPLVGLVLVLMWPVTQSAQMAVRGTDWSGMCEYLLANARPGDVIIGSQYYNGTMSWCIPPRLGVVVTRSGRYSPADLVASGRPSWYVQIDIEPVDPALVSLGYTRVPQAEIERPGTHHRDIRRDFPYRISERPSRLFRGPSVHPVASVQFNDIDGERVAAGWPDHAMVIRQGRYLVTLALATTEPRHLRVDYLDGPGRETVVLVDGAELARLQATAQTDRWATTKITLPSGSPWTIAVEIRATGSTASLISSLALEISGQ